MDRVSVKEVATLFPAPGADALHQDCTSPLLPSHVDAVPSRWHGAISHSALAGVQRLWKVWV